MWMLQVCPLSASNSYPSHDIALYKATDGKVADDKTRETLLKAVKARDAEAIAKAVKEVNESKTVKAKAECVCSIESGPCERVESLQMSGRF